MTAQRAKPNARDLLGLAEALLLRADPELVGIWPRASAMLARQSLELALETLWRRRAPGLELCSLRAQLLCLAAYLNDGALAADATHAWGALSRACHHHPYELPPTERELRRLMETVGVLLGAVDQRVA